MNHLKLTKTHKVLASLVALIILLFSGAGLTVNAALESLPGDALYPLKYGAESVQHLDVLVKALATLPEGIQKDLQGTKTQQKHPANSIVNSSTVVDGNLNGNINLNGNTNENTNENLNGNTNENSNEDLNDNGQEGDKGNLSFEGTIDQISQNLVVASGVSFSITQDTKIDGNILVGDRVEVEYIQSGSDSQTALKIEVKESNTGDENKGEISLSGTGLIDNSRLEDQSNENGSLITNDNGSSITNENESIANNNNSEDHHSVNENTNQDEGREIEHEGHD